MSSTSKIVLSIIFSIFSNGMCIGQNESHEIDSLKKVIKSGGDKHEIIKTKSLLFINLFLAGKDKEALKIYSEALKEAIALNSDAGLSSLYLNYGTYLYNLNDFDSAMYYYKLASKHSVSSKDKKIQLRALNNIASIQFMKGDYMKALDNYNKGLKVESDLGYKEGDVVSINNIGFVYDALEINKKAYQYFKKAEGIYKKNNKLNSLLYSYEGLSTTYSKMNMQDSAILYGEKHLVLAKKLNDLYGLGYSYDNLGMLYRGAGNNKKALEYFNEGLKVYEQTKEVRLLMSIYGNIAETYLMLGDMDKANSYFELIMKNEKDFHITIDKKSFNRFFAEISYRRGEYKKAYDYLKLYLMLRDSAYTKEVSQQIAELNARYETERKDKNNLLLQKENERKEIELESNKSFRNFLFIIIGLFVVALLSGLYFYKKIKEFNKELGSKNNSIEHKNKELEEQKKEILDSIHYAKRIQSTLLAHKDFIDANLPDNFILFKPKDIVSGDFYWATKKDDHFYFAICDSTGHGVPGAFMSLLNIGFLNEAINEKNIAEPNKVFNYVRERLENSISKEGQKDGFDGVLLCFNSKTGKITYAAAHNSPVLIRNKELISLQTNKMPVGIGEIKTDFDLFTIDYQKDDLLIVYTDGYADQFGGPKGKKFMYKQLNSVLSEISTEPMDVQRTKLSENFEKWRGTLEQVDDVCVIGIRL